MVWGCFAACFLWWIRVSAVCLATFSFFLTHSGHISLLYGFFCVASHHWLWLTTVAPFGPAPLSTVIHIKKQSSPSMMKHDLAAPCQTALCQRVFPSHFHCRMSWANLRIWTCFLTAAFEKGAFCDTHVVINYCYPPVESASFKCQCWISGGCTTEACSYLAHSCG